MDRIALNFASVSAVRRSATCKSSLSQSDAVAVLSITGIVSPAARRSVLISRHSDDVCKHRYAPHRDWRQRQLTQVALGYMLDTWWVQAVQRVCLDRGLHHQVRANLRIGHFLFKRQSSRWSLSHLCRTYGQLPARVASPGWRLKIVPSREVTA